MHTAQYSHVTCIHGYLCSKPLKPLSLWTIHVHVLAFLCIQLRYDVCDVIVIVVSYGSCTTKYSSSDHTIHKLSDQQLYVKSQPGFPANLVDYIGFLLKRSFDYRRKKTIPAIVWHAVVNQLGATWSAWSFIISWNESHNSETQDTSLNAPHIPWYIIFDPYNSRFRCVAY